jgi:hypothetical protein
MKKERLKKNPCDILFRYRSLEMRNAAKKAMEDRGLVDERSYINQLIIEDLKRNEITIKPTLSHVGTLEKIN